MARLLARKLEPYSPYFIEEPVLPGDTQALLDVTRSTTIPIAAGERCDAWQFQEVIERQAVAVIQPDLLHCGGILEARKIAAMAESRNIAVAPHCPLGPIALAASLQFAACTPNFLIQEHVTLGEGLLTEPFRVETAMSPLRTNPASALPSTKTRCGRGFLPAIGLRRNSDSPTAHSPSGNFHVRSSPRALHESIA